MPVYTAHDKTITIYCGDLFAFKEDNLGGFDCIFDHGSIGSFDLTKVKRTTYAEIMDSFTKPGGRILLSFFDYEHSEHPLYPLPQQKRKWQASTGKTSKPQSCCMRLMLQKQQIFSTWIPQLAQYSLSGHSAAFHGS